MKTFDTVTKIWNKVETLKVRQKSMIYSTTNGKADHIE